MAHAAITEDALGELVGRFYASVRRDPLLAPVFEPAVADWDAHLTMLQAFWSSVMLTSGRYKGRPLPAHIKHGDAMTDERFGRWLALWRETANALFEPAPAAALIEKAERIAESLQLGIAFGRGGGMRLRLA